MTQEHRGIEGIENEANEDRPHFGAILGFVHEQAPEGQAVIELVVRPEHCNRRGVIHGGVLMSLIDAAGLWAGVEKNEGLPSAATVGLNCSFLRGAKLGATTSLRAEAAVTRRGRSIHFASVSVYSLPENNLVATGQGIYSWSASPKPDTSATTQ
ncbi:MULTISPECIES: PaaI family thioesterase [Alcaligenaceae]|uniref:Thioesterase superfamily member 2 n=1 Tax=Bordetella petrii (strain ATCC BAA-461 / DSM 12804 / CCUG 43448 / CIP 107267 / Se-1111R) TaxID=340100 RepID=A9ICI1_BORPD|nr:MULTISPECIES: PaaI family thioesterase [Alcaligenaceae]CAP41569.1 Thioesterase superfamily member 2 [Bordetella petrii]CUJ31393.1 Uncharacterized protein%2C possibly involved in aromatic compounds catabolism [Achromobacter xylosoxidans]CUJ71463.1 Uncharacterized protein%2C possibly involved in aromatic compounds catabolism [Achromobacter xylosoxidans]